MINQMLVNILVKRIQSRWINPKTNKPLVIDDILIEEYKISVLQELTSLGFEDSGSTVK